MIKNKIIFSILPVLLGLFFVSMTNAQVSKYPQITEQFCDAKNRCPEGLECYSFPGIGSRCAQSDPCSYFKCPQGTQCSGVTESVPGQVICRCVGPECTATSGDQQTVSYDLLTKTVIHTIDKNKQPVSHDVSLRKTTPGNKGILETAFASVEYSNELTIEESKLLMKTSVGKKPINIMPEDAIAISETPNLGTVKKIELKEESQKPVYSVKGTKQARILFIFPVSLEVETKVSAETGKVVSVIKPLWSFLAW